MATSQLSLYQGALAFLGQPELASLTENREPRHLLDRFYTDDDGIKIVLEHADWNFATRTVKVEFDSALTPDFGLNRAFSKPTDWVRTSQQANDEYFTTPLVDHQFKDEQGYWFADIDTIYVRYVSDDDSYGRDLSLWPSSFVEYFQAYMAMRIAPRLDIAEASKDKLEERVERLYKSAASKDARNEGIKFPPESGWPRSRRGRYGQRDIGSRGRLTGR
jgi:hypothetical protein